jgi:hypothetical protein
MRDHPNAPPLGPWRSPERAALRVTAHGTAVSRLRSMVKLDVDPQGPKVKAEFVGGGLQIQWGGTLPAGTAKRPRH